ncbi:hypothetical protein [uncultured Gimesia sp.]|uniref:hypothetical protein n=1 Tax=uncultured Gimesia sp. TaxID=1678688 RepID=UPI0030DC506E
MKTLTATTRTTRSRIFGTADSGRLVAQATEDEPFQECEVRLGIQRDSDSGYLLILSPAGYFTVDAWHDSLEAVQNRARDLLGVNFEEWSL